ncbi:MAG: hypothetical protein ACIAQU_08055, partial [Phycisphaerales bacterium JB064]
DDHARQGEDDQQHARSPWSFVQWSIALAGRTALRRRIVGEAEAVGEARPVALEDITLVQIATPYVTRFARYVP